MSQVELIVSANGCVDNTLEFLGNLKTKFTELGFEDHLKITWHEKPLGYSRATNEGIKLATSDYIILMSNDSILLPQPKHRWIEQLVQPFQQNENCGITCPLKIKSEAANTTFGVFFCVMVSRKVFDRIGLINEEYGVGGGEDIEFCIEAEKAGFEVCEIVSKEFLSNMLVHVGNFPIYHKGEGTVHDTTLIKDWPKTLFRNYLRLAKKYNKEWYYANAKNIPVDHKSLEEQNNFIYDEIFKTNAYNVEKHEIENKIVIDIGANVGMFSLLCHELSAQKIYAIEAQPTIYKIDLINNTISHSNIDCFNFAVLDDFGKFVKIIDQGGLSKISDQGESTPTITLEKFLVDNRINHNNMVLKIDCEGSEFDILLSTRNDILQRFETIYMELHGDTHQVYKDPNIVRNKLVEAGFVLSKQMPLLGKNEFGEWISLNIFCEKWKRV